MSNIQQICIIKKDTRILTSISTMPTKDVYRMLYAAIKLVANQTGQTVKSILCILDDLDNFVKASEQE